MADCSAQVAAPKVGLLDVLRDPYFAQGYTSVAKGRSPQPYSSRQKEWLYERGRLVATEALEKFGHVPKLWFVRHIGNREDGFVVNPKIIDLAWSMLVDFS